MSECRYSILLWAEPLICVRLSPLLLRIDDIQCIYMQVLDKVHVDTSSVISTQDVVQKIVDVSVDLHKQVQRLFQGKVHFGIVFTFCDLARMFQRIEASLDIIHTLEDLLLLWQHESYWTYAGKLSSDADVARYLDTFGMALKKQFSNIPMVSFCTNSMYNTHTHTHTHAHAHTYCTCLCD